MSISKQDEETKTLIDEQASTSIKKLYKVEKATFAKLLDSFTAYLSHYCCWKIELNDLKITHASFVMLVKTLKCCPRHEFFMYLVYTCLYIFGTEKKKIYIWPTPFNIAVFGIMPTGLIYGYQLTEKREFEKKKFHETHR